MKSGINAIVKGSAELSGGEVGFHGSGPKNLDRRLHRMWAPMFGRVPIAMIIVWVKAVMFG